MSLFAVVLAASAGLVPAVPAAHSVDIEHRGERYRVEYHPRAEARVRTVGAATGARPATQRCVVTASIGVERVIAGGQGGHELKATLPGRETYTRPLHGDCRGRGDLSKDMLASKAPQIAAMLEMRAAQDRHAALAAIDSAHHFAAN